MVAFADRLKELRTEKGLTQRELAKVISVSSSTVAMWETGDREPNHDMLRTLAAYFDCSIDYLLGLANHKKPEIIDLAAHRVDGDYDKPLSPETYKIIEEAILYAERKYGRKPTTGGEQNNAGTNKDSREGKDND